MPLTFIHAADFHLGADLRRFGPARDRLEKAQFHALEKTLQWAANDRADFILICGDLFDSRNPRKSIIRKTGDIFSSHPDMPIYILPGTHDFLSDSSVFAPGNDDWTGDNVIILNNTIASPYRIPETDCYLYFCPNRSNRSTISPIAGFVPQRKEGFHIGMAHGSLNIGGIDVAYDFPINPAEIEKSELNYLALGHWHKGRIEKYGKTTSAYPGIGQPISWSDPEEGSVLLVSLDDTGNATTARRSVSSIIMKKIRSTIYHPAEVRLLLKKAEDQKTIVKLILSYSDNFKETLEVEKIIEKASSRFLLVQSESKNSQFPKASLQDRKDTYEQLLRAFETELAHLREADSPGRSELYDKAAELGAEIIAGEKR